MSTHLPQRASRRGAARAQIGRKQSSERFPIAAVGVAADAGEALREFLGALRAGTRLACVVLQHAPPAHPPLRASDLGSSSPLAAVDVRDATLVEPDHVYIVPADEQYMLQSGVLRRADPQLRAHPFDHFLHSLAEDRGMLARGVVLSGRGTDAAEGLLAIRQRGGLAFAQDPATARDDGMSSHAIAARAVDFVLSPQRIAEELLARSAQHGLRERAGRRDTLATLRAQLDEARVHQQVSDRRHAVSHDELTDANQELRAANEELSAMNDELQTARDRAGVVFERMQRFLNEAGRMLLSESTESRSALKKLARMAVPALAEVCLIDVVDDDGTIAPAALASEHPETSTVRLEARDERLTRDSQDVVPSVVRSGQHVLESRLDEAALARIGGARASLLRACGARSYLCVPLQGRGGVLGALSLASSRADRHYGADDVTLAEGLGQRAGMALETARLYRAAREAVQLRDEFLAVASHELRTPLTALSLQLENLQSLVPPAAGANGHDVLGEKLARALRYTARLGRLIESLLAVSRIMAGHLSLQLDDVDLSAIAREVVERMRSDAARARCTLDLHTSGPVRGHWDAMRLDQIVTNLLSNAIRHAPGAPVHVSVAARGRAAVLTVEDGGPGIARERLPLIFERYEIAGERVTSGLGLGLYIIRQIAEAHGGHARVETELGHGARFVVELPFDGAPARAAGEDPS